jgi:peptidoglycan/LPS O-acetylase OafA/YrhL
MLTKKIEHIDSLRGVAILMVILVHTSQSITGNRMWVDIIAEYGQLCVQLFFVISAYTLCMSGKVRAEEKHATKIFYIKRFFRIAPHYYLGIVFYYFLLFSQSSILQKSLFPHTHHG